MDAVLLAAGKGKRTGELGEKRQKTSFFLENNLDVLDKFFKRIFIIVGHRKKDIEGIVSKSKIKNRIILIEQKEQLGNANAIYLAKKYISEPFIVANGDIWLKDEFFAEILKVNAPALAVSEVANPWEYGILKLDKEDYVREIVEKPEKGKEPSNLAINGIYYFRQSIFGAIEKTKLNERKKEYLITDSMDILMKDEKIKAVVTEMPKHIITAEDIKLG